MTATADAAAAGSPTATSTPTPAPVTPSVAATPTPSTAAPTTTPSTAATPAATAATAPSTGTAADVVPTGPSSLAVCTIAPSGRLTLGVTHDHYSADSWFAPTAVAAAKSILAADTTLQNQSLMGWGANNPEPSPGVYDWSSLDDRMALIRATGGTTVLTAAGAPDWMKGGTPGTTDWSRIEVAPTPSHDADYAALVAATVARYPQIRYVQVWNELKGFWDADTNTWDAAGYTALYNAVYRAVKAVDPTVAVGGPYVVVDSWSSAAVASNPSAVSGPWGVLDQRALDVLTYWFAHAAGADFVAVDATSATKDAGITVDPVAATAKFGAITAWLRARTALPIWWSELHLGTATHTATPAELDAALGQVSAAGGNAVLMWDPQHEAGDTDPWLWTDVRTASGGQAGPFADVWARWRAA